MDYYFNLLKLLFLLISLDYFSIKTNHLLNFINLNLLDFLISIKF